MGTSTHRKTRRLACCVAAAGVMQALAPQTTAAFGDESPIKSYYYFVHEISMGRIDEALEQFSDDATVVAGALCTPQAPCRGKAAIRERYIAELVARGRGAPVSDQRFDGRCLRTHGEITYVMEPGRGMLRLVGGHVFEFRDGRIASIDYEFDVNDPVTARYLAEQTAAALAANR